jgi:RHS repeat-associated protein
VGNHAGSASQVITLPQGGGALKGMGEKFSPDLFTGTGNLSIPIPLPAGRNGFQPQLNLSYSTGAGNGPFGLGWNLSVPEVSRKTSTGVPRYRDTPGETNQADTYILAGAEDLVPVPGAEPGLQAYRPRTESLFAIIEHHHSGGQNFWRVRTKEGQVSTYGTERPEGAGEGWQDPAVIQDPINPRKIFTWMLTQTQDPFGNTIQYEYQRDRPADGPRRWDQLYLKRIRYVNYLDDSGQEAFLISVTLEYGDPALDRPDLFSVFRSGFEIRTRLRCESLRVRTHAGEDRLVRLIRLHYESAGSNGVSMLHQVELLGSDEVERMPRLTFGYTRFEPQARNFFPAGGRDLPAGCLDDPNLELADLFGNGLPDLIEMNGTVRYWRNLGEGCFDQPRFMRDAPAGLSLGEPGVQLMDVDGNGQLDLTAFTEGLFGYFPLGFNGEWDRHSFQRQRFAPSFGFEDPEVRLVDLNGDGITDAIRSGARMELFFNHPQHGWGETRRVEREELSVFPNLSFADERVHLVDLTGDGLQDVALVYDGSIEYWPSLGYGDWGRRVGMRNSPHFPFGYDPRRILFGDVDGDGLSDLVYVDHRQVYLWINQGGEAWSNPLVIDGTPDLDSGVAVRMVDLLGTGIAGLLWSREAGGLPAERMFFLDFTGGRKPYLLNDIDNQMGSLTRIEYAPSTQFYLQDQVSPMTRWKTNLPFPVQVVSRVEVIDQLSGGKLTTAYNYHHGCWDGGEREFRGFGLVEQLDTQRFEAYNGPGLHGAERGFTSVEPLLFSPPTLTRTWFHQGPVGDELGDWEELDWSDEYWPGDPPLLNHKASIDAFLRTLPDRHSRRDALRSLRGSVLRTELYALDGSPLEDRPYTVTETASGLREESPPGPEEAGRQRIFFAHTLAQRTTQYERGDDPLTKFEFKENYDAFGQPRDQVAIGCPRGWRGLDDRVPVQAPFLATCSRTDFADSPGEEPYIKDRVVRTSSFHLRQRGERTLFELKAENTDPEALDLIGQSLAYYDGEAFTGLPFGQVGAFGAVVRSETLLLTESIVQKAYEAGTSLPPYLVPGGPPAWTSDYPLAFQQQVAHLAGYTFFDGSGPQARGYFVSYGCTRYDFQSGPGGFGLPVATRDPMGRQNSLTYDAFGLLPEQVTDPAGLVQQVRYDYRVLQPFLSIDANGNRIQYSFSALGFLTGVSVMGKDGEDVGDTPEVPGTWIEYDFLAFENSPPGDRQPISVRTIQREHHLHADTPPGQEDEVLVRVEFSDGFGRLIQKRIQAEEVLFGDNPFGTDIIPADQGIAPGPSLGRSRAPGSPPNVVVSGWQVYDNKGQVVEQYEPFYDTGFEYRPPEAAQFGQTTRIFYDPRGQTIRTRHPNGSVNRMIFGIPARLDTPEDFEPTPWEAYTYSVNDNAGSFSGKHNVPASHWNTPANIEIDALGRVVRSVSRQGPEQTGELVTRSEYDLRGNLLRITDPLGRTAYSYVYDLSSSKNGAAILREDCLDAGPKQFTFDSTGREIERRDAAGTLILQAYDHSGRPTHLWARDEPGQAATLRQRMIYGENSGLAQPEAGNHLGKLYQHFDEAGLLEMSSYDFKGNLLRQSRRVIRDEEIQTVMGGPVPTGYAVDWDQDLALDILEDRSYQTNMTYDGLNRLVRVTYPEDVNGERKVLLPEYNRAGGLEKVGLLSADGGERRAFVERIAYNAKGQRALIAFGDGLMTRYAYDPPTCHLVRMRTEKYKLEGEANFTPQGGVLQDVGYCYDLLGEVVQLSERSLGCGIPGTPLGPDALDREFAYDPLGRLIRGTGREHTTRNPSAEPWLDAVSHTNQDVTQVRAYAREYAYDALGTLTDIQHTTPNGAGNFTRTFTIAPDSNHLESFDQGGLDFPCQYDPRGNLARQAASHHFAWNHSSRLAAFRLTDGAGNASAEAVYLYDSLGQRVKKLVRTGGRVETTTTLANSFEHRTSGTQEQDLLHIMDEQRRISLLRIGPAFVGEDGPAIQYIHSDHLENSTVTVDQNGNSMHREEFYPYGGTSFGSFARKRYRFTGKERDEESGLSYHRNRYYAPWILRWISPDPAGKGDGLNLYAYARDNPLSLVDPTGTSAMSWIQSAFSKSWSFAKSFGEFQWSGDAFGYEFPVGRNPYDWQKEALELIWDKTKKYWTKTKQVASNLWGWAKEHKLIASGLGVVSGILAYFTGKWLLNWVVAPAIRMGTNAAFGYVMWGKAGAFVGAGLGLIHGWSMAYAGTYKTPLSWVAFIFDNSWSLFNSFAGSFFNLVGLAAGASINQKNSKEYGGLYYDNWFDNVSTTIGNVTLGKTVPDHEFVHVLQGRILGPAYIPAVIFNYEVATLLPYWVFFKDCKINGFIDYFTKGVYPNTWNEAMAYEQSGDRCSI